MRNICAPGGREKRFVVNADPSKKFLKSRVVFVDDLVSTIINGVWSQNFFAALKGSSKGSGDLFLGESFAYGKFHFLAQRMDDAQESKSADGKGFDTTISRGAIIGAFSLIRSCYPTGIKIDRLFNYMCANFINTLIIVPNGDLYIIDGTNPSGNPWTTLINSIVT